MMAANMTKPKFIKVKSQATAFTPLVADDLLEWLAVEEGGSRRDEGLEYLLATTFSEVVWGKQEGDTWRLSNKAVTLPVDSLLELRAFGPDAEIFIWRDATGLRARLRRDGEGDEECDTYEEEQLLWGTVRLDDAPPGFTRLAEGDQGLEHAPPLDLDNSYFITNEKDKRFGHRPARLELRHYVRRDQDTGLARVVDSRLVKVRREPLPAA